MLKNQSHKRHSVFSLFQQYVNKNLVCNFYLQKRAELAASRPDLFRPCLSTVVELKFDANTEEKHHWKQVTLLNQYLKK